MCVCRYVYVYMDICILHTYVCMYVCMCVYCDVVKPCYSVSLLHITVIFVMIIHSTHILSMFIKTLYHQQLWLPCFILSLLKYIPFNGSGVAVTPYLTISPLNTPDSMNSTVLSSCASE